VGAFCVGGCGKIWAGLKMESVMKFEWDDVKAASNLKKHGVDFEEAKTVFDDGLANIFDDVWNSIGEQRELVIGTSNAQRLLVISFTERADAIRIISARPATTTEVKNYERDHRN
jgi:uncharacterized DUF497 family protein